MDQKVGDRDISDHRLVWIKENNAIWGPKPFKVFNYWYEHLDFLEFVKREWNYFKVDGGVSHVLKEKFKLLRERLRWWNKNVFGWVDLKIEERVNTLNDTEVGMERDPGKILVSNLLKRNVVQEDIWNNLHLKESMLKKSQD